MSFDENKQAENDQPEWRSIEDHPDFADSEKISQKALQEDLEDSNKEFPKAVRELIERGVNPEMNRKTLLTVMGAGLSMATANCFKEPLEKIVPYADRPVESQPGIPTPYATSRVTSEGVIPMVVKAREGKPIKIEGLKKHPVIDGCMSADDFATIWDLYDPDRVKNPQKKDKSISWETAIKEVRGLLKGNVAVLSRASYSPSESAAMKTLVNKIAAKKVTYDPVGAQQGILEASEASYGKAVIPHYRLDKTDLILSIETDFLGRYVQSDLLGSRFIRRRDPEKKSMTRLIAVESIMTLTGGNADTRFTMKAGTHMTFALGLAKLIVKGTQFVNNATVKKLVGDFTPELVESVTGVKSGTLRSIAKELKLAKGKSVVFGGGVSTRNEKFGKLELVVNLINSALGNNGKTIHFTAPVKEGNDISDTKTLKKLVKDMKAGKIDTLVVDRANPVFELPQPLGFEEALKKVKSVIVIDSHETETAKYASYILPISHFLEGWSDARTSGTYSIVQPTIRPLYNTLDAGEIYLRLAGNKSRFIDFIKKGQASSFKAASWHKLLTTGFTVEKKAQGGNAPGFKTASLSGISAPKKPLTGYRLVLFQNLAIGEGAGANNSLRQELPDSISKVTWENYVAIAPADAKSNKWKDGDILKIKANGKTVKLPVMVQPGLKSKTMGIAIGYGHTALGEVAQEAEGENAMKLAGFGNDYTYTGIPVSATKVDSGYTVATTQKHGDMNERDLVRTSTFEIYKSDPKKANPESKMHAKGLYPGHEYKTYRWAMNIDLSKCTGCSACVVSCQTENNIPVVGRKEVTLGREMSWIRIDRYYRGDLENPEVLFQPLICQHCENAPCENVCPVGATTHSAEGLNDMAYNRCIGTRYCSNNCPYKVRRFNWFENWEGKLKDPQHMALNPNVTVRSRGVIEKCSFCVQRINQKRQEAHVNKVEGSKEIGKDGYIVDDWSLTSCQEACSTSAITFGDINSYGNRETKIAKLEKTGKRNYKILDFLNVKPMVTYQVRIKNDGKKGKKA